MQLFYYILLLFYFTILIVIYFTILLIIIIYCTILNIIYFTVLIAIHFAILIVIHFTILIIIYGCRVFWKSLCSYSHTDVAYYWLRSTIKYTGTLIYYRIFYQAGFVQGPLGKCTEYTDDA